MKIQILELIEGARKAEGTAVVIDVFRAFTVESCLFSQGAEKIFPVGDLADAFQMKKDHPEYLLFGERGGARVEGCDFGNSPSGIKNLDFRGKTVIHTTSAGTQGIVGAAAAGARQILAAGLVNAKATAEYILKQDPEVVSIVAMGQAGLQRAGEDVLCAEYIRSCLEGRPFDVQKEAEALKDTWGAHFFDPARQHIYPSEDFYMSIQCDRFDFAIRAEHDENGRLITVRA